MCTLNISFYKRCQLPGIRALLFPFSFLDTIIWHHLPIHLTYKSSFNHLYFIPVRPLFQDRICERNVFGQDFLQGVILYQRNEFPLRLIKCKNKISIRADSRRRQARTLTALPLRVARLAVLICIYLHAGLRSGGPGCPGSGPAASAAERGLSLVDVTM